MIDILKNCPNCGSIIDEVGRCQHCGSKLYDLFDIDVKERGKKFIRIKSNRGIIIAPVVFESVDMELYMEDRCPTVNINFLVVGKVSIIPQEGES